MTKTEKQSDPDPAAAKKAARMMLCTLFSTTVRIFAPVTILFIIGLVIDLNTPSKPWGMMTGTILGMIIAIVLVVMQLKSIRQAPIKISQAEGED